MTGTHDGQRATIGRRAQNCGIEEAIAETASKLADKTRLKEEDLDATRL